MHQIVALNCKCIKCLVTAYLIVLISYNLKLIVNPNNLESKATSFILNEGNPKEHLISKENLVNSIKGKLCNLNITQNSCHAILLIYC